jgi:hypothetical protein
MAVVLRLEKCRESRIYEYFYVFVPNFIYLCLGNIYKYIYIYFFFQINRLVLVTYNFPVEIFFSEATKILWVV